MILQNCFRTGPMRLKTGKRRPEAAAQLATLYT
jgi:hypothetical protein